MDSSDFAAAVVAIIVGIILAIMTANAMDAEMAITDAKVAAHVGRMK